VRRFGVQLDIGRERYTDDLSTAVNTQLPKHTLPVRMDSTNADFELLSYCGGSIIRKHADQTLSLPRRKSEGSYKFVPRHAFE